MREWLAGFEDVGRLSRYPPKEVVRLVLDDEVELAEVVLELMALLISS